MDSLTNSSVAPETPSVKRRRPAWLPAATALFFALLTAWLCHWQLDRAQQKHDLEARYASMAGLPPLPLSTLPTDWRALLYRRVRIGGVFDAPYQIFVDNRIYHDRPGYHVITPIRLRSGALLVNRGWLPAAADRSTEPHAAPPAGRQTVAGILVPAQSRFLELSAASVQGPVWQNLDWKRYRTWYRRPDLPDVILLQTSPASDGLIRDWPRPDLGIERHLGYAVQWFAMTAAIVTLYLYFGIWKPRHAPD
jgi:surfeit locus 1 family protein